LYVFYGTEPKDADGLPTGEPRSIPNGTHVVLLAFNIVIPNKSLILLKPRMPVKLSAIN
jgi:hypothetical protein